MNLLNFARSNLRWLVGGVLLALFSGFGQTFFISLFGDAIRESYALSHGEFGLLYMMSTLASALTLVWLGKIVDWLSPVNVTMMVCVALALACLAMSWNRWLPGLFVVIWFLRLFGQGMMMHIAMTTMGRWFVAERGRAISISASGYHLGEALLPILVVSLLQVIAWRSVWLIAAGMLLLVMPLLHYCLRVPRVPSGRRADGDDRETGRQWTRQEVLRDARFWLLCCGTLAPSFIGTAFFFHQNYLTELNGWPKNWIALHFPVLSITTALVAVIAGIVIDRIGALRLLPLYLLPLAAGCLLAGLSSQPWVLFFWMLLTGLSYGVATTLLGTLWPEVYGVRHLGAIRAVTMALMVFSSAAGPGVTGLLIDLHIDFQTQLVACGIYCLLACIVLKMVADRYQAIPAPA